jgi:hypothetical protein
MRLALFQKKRPFLHMRRKAVQERVSLLILRDGSAEKTTSACPTSDFEKALRSLIRLLNMTEEST